MTSGAGGTEPLLRTLAPALRGLERSLRRWLDAQHIYPLSTLARANLEGLANDLRRQAEALDVDRPLLIIMLMGGTGVGKSTLLNALAGGAIAQASFTRPTTRDPVVYYHQSVRPDRLDLALQHCRLAAHDRPALEQKILVDTPDLDSNDLSNRAKLERLLPVADIVLYVGSQEKYHDQLGWKLFLEQRRRRAFAFVLNKWDRCLHRTNASGLRPDEDLLRDLQEEGFRKPLLFRTCAQTWVDQMTRENGELPVTAAAIEDRREKVADLPDGEQFGELVRWLEMGLTRLEIEAIKARGVSQLLEQLEKALESACPPDVTEPAERLQPAWHRLLQTEAEATTDVLLNTLEPYQREIEHHFTVEGQRRFRGLMGGYLHLLTRLKYAGSNLRDRLPFLPRPAQGVHTPTTWDVAAFSSACSSAAAERHLDARGRALADRLLVEADRMAFPVALLDDPTRAVSKLDWRQRYAQALVEVLQRVEQQWSQPTGARRWVHSLVVLVAGWLPEVGFLGALALFLWRYFDVMGKDYRTTLSDVFLPFVVLLVILVLMHVVIALLLPLRWPAIRNEFNRQLRTHLEEDLQKAYIAIPGNVATGLRAERRQVEELLKEVREVAAWLRQREQAASIEGLYGQ